MSDKETEGGDSQAPGFADDLAKAFDDLEAVETGDDQPEADAAAEQEAETGEGEQPDTEAQEAEAADAGDDGDQPEAEAEGDEDGQEDEGEEQLAVPDAPEHWSETDKESFNSLPDEAKPLYLDKVKSLESGFNRKFEELADQRKALEPYQGFHDLFEPFRQDLATAGITAEQYTRQLVATALQMRQDPTATLQALAQSHGVDLNTLVGKPEGADDEFDEFTDPQIVALTKQNRELEAKLAGISTRIDQSQTQARQASDADVLREWAVFAQSKDDQGNDRYPQAEALRVQVGEELQRSPQRLGETMHQAFARAYDVVRWANPDLRQSLLDAEVSKAREEVEAKAKKTVEAAKSEVQRKQDVDKAKKAGRTVKSKSTSVGDAPAVGETWKEEVEKQWDEAASAA